MGEKKTTTGTCGLLEGGSPNKYQKKKKRGSTKNMVRCLVSVSFLHIAAILTP